MNNLSIITIGSALNKEIYLTIESVIKFGEIPKEWIFVVFNQIEKNTLDEYINSNIKQLKSYRIFTNSKGISSSMNTALNTLISKDTFIWILHAGDLCIRKFKTNNSNYFYAFHFFPIYIKKINSNSGYISYTSKNWLSKIKKKPCVMHQGLLAHSSIFKEFGLFDENLKSIMDYEWFYRISNSIKKHNFLCTFYTEPIAEFKLGGKSANIIESVIEHYKVFKRYGDSLFIAIFKSAKLFIKKFLYILLNY